MISGFSGRAVRLAAMAVVAMAVCVTALGGVAWAMRVSPMVVELTTKGAGTSARIEVGNVGSVPLPFETTITRLTFEDDGSVTETPADEDFLVFPPQGLVAVNGRQMVRLQWIGAPDLEASQAYYLAVRQLPVSQDRAPAEDGGSIAVQVLYNMKALVVVAPPGAEPDVKVQSTRVTVIETPSEVIEGEEARPPVREPGVEVIVRNDGKRYALMSGATWVIEGTARDGTPYRQQLASGSELSAIIGVGYAAPLGGRRTFALPTGGVELDPAKPVSVKFTR